MIRTYRVTVHGPDGIFNSLIRAFTAADAVTQREVELRAAIPRRYVASVEPIDESELPQDVRAR